MEKIIMFLKKLFSLKDKKGFSLIELLVVVAIIGILAAVAIPVYNNYRVNAAQGAITSSLQNIGKGFAACLTLNPFSRCDDLQKIGVDCPSCQTVNHNSGNVPFCVSAASRVGGQTWQGCVQTTGGVPLVLGNWPSPCSNVSIEYGCMTAGGTVDITPTVTCSTLNCMASVAVPTTCSGSDTDVSHSCATGNQDDLTNPGAFMGVCGANGECS